MVTQTTENGRQKCARYWPNAGTSEALTGVQSEVSIELTNEIDEHDGVIERTLQFRIKAENAENAEIREIRQIQFVDWPDHGVPHDPSHFLVFLNKVREYRKEIRDQSPTIVSV